MTAKITRADEARWRAHEIDHGLCVCGILDALDAARQMAVALDELLAMLNEPDWESGFDAAVEKASASLAAFAALVDLS